MAADRLSCLKTLGTPSVRETSPMPRQHPSTSSRFESRRAKSLFVATARTYVPLALSIIAGCHAVGPDYKTPATTMPSAFGEPAPMSRRLGPPAPAEQRPTELGLWWTSFNDPELDSLVQRATERNLTLEMATERIIEARANRQIAVAGLFPTVNGVGSYTRTKGSKNGTGSSGSSSNGSTTTGGTTTSGGTTSGSTSGGTKAIDLWEAGFDATWELDVFGGIRRQVESADASTLAAIEDRRDTLVTLLGEVANDYITLRGAQRQLAITRDNLKSEQDTLKLTQTRFKAGLTSDLDVANAEAQVASTASDIPGYETTIRTSIFSLSVLIAQEPQSLSEELTPDGPIPSAIPNVPVGLPSELLRRRPDVRRAERQLAAATANIGVATADLYPQFSLTGETGLQSLQLKKLVNGNSWFYSLGPSVNWDLFDAGRVRANIDLQNSLQRQALETYQAAVLQALSDVDSALVTYDREQTRRVSLSQSVESNQRAVNLSIQLYTRGLLDFLSVLDAERSLFSAQSLLVQSDQNVSTDLVALYKSLGGGWQTGI
jgi:NodT family efflux transporter outer membrane factor (OMF) lipoprotein